MYEYANQRGGGLPLTAEEICNCVVQWVQQFIEEQLSPNGDLKNNILQAVQGSYPIDTTVENGEVTVSLDVEAMSDLFSTGVLIDSYALADRIQGSDSVVVDVTANASAIEIRLDREIIEKLDRVVLKPLHAPIEPKLPVLGVDNAVTWEPVSSFTGGGGGGYIFRISGPNGSFNINLPVEVPSSYDGLKDFLYRNNITFSTSYFIPCSGVSGSKVVFACGLDNINTHNIIMRAFNIIDGVLNIEDINLGTIGSFMCIKLT